MKKRHDHELEVRVSDIKGIHPAAADLGALSFERPFMPGLDRIGKTLFRVLIEDAPVGVVRCKGRKGYWAITNIETLGVAATVLGPDAHIPVRLHCRCRPTEIRIRLVAELVVRPILYGHRDASELGNIIRRIPRSDLHILFGRALTQSEFAAWMGVKRQTVFAKVGHRKLFVPRELKHENLMDVYAPGGREARKNGSKS